MSVQTTTTQAGFSYLDCTCDRTAIRIRTQRNGVQIYAVQCLDCGRQLRAVSKNAPEIVEMPNRMPFDETLQDQWAKRQREYADGQRRAREHDRKLQDAEWWAWYSAYLETTEWRLKRQAVLQRDNYLCQGCRQRQATQAHHLTYEHVGNEFLFELIAICETCHRRIHAKDEQ